MGALGVMLAGGVPAAGQTPTPTPTPTAPITPPEDLNRIRAALSHPPALNLAGDKLRFYLEVHATPTPFWSFVGLYDLQNGPVKRAPMTGQEFLDMMRPKQLYSSAGITAPELLQFALTNVAAQALIRKAIHDIRDARTEAEVRQIRERINRELLALKGGGQ